MPQRKAEMGKLIGMSLRKKDDWKPKEYNFAKEIYDTFTRMKQSITSKVTMSCTSIRVEEVCVCV